MSVGTAPHHGSKAKALCQRRQQTQSAFQARLRRRQDQRCSIRLACRTRDATCRNQHRVDPQRACTRRAGPLVSSQARAARSTCHRASIFDFPSGGYGQSISCQCSMPQRSHIGHEIVMGGDRQIYVDVGPLDICGRSRAAGSPRIANSSVFPRRKEFLVRTRRRCRQLSPPRVLALPLLQIRQPASLSMMRTVPRPCGRKTTRSKRPRSRSRWKEYRQARTWNRDAAREAPRPRKLRNSDCNVEWDGGSCPSVDFTHAADDARGNSTVNLVCCGGICRPDHDASGVVHYVAEEYRSRHAKHCCGRRHRDGGHLHPPGHPRRSRLCHASPRLRPYFRQGERERLPHSGNFHGPSALVELSNNPSKDEPVVDMSLVARAVHAALPGNTVGGTIGDDSTVFSDGDVRYKAYTGNPPVLWTETRVLTNQGPNRSPEIKSWVIKK